MTPDRYIAVEHPNTVWWLVKDTSSNSYWADFGHTTDPDQAIWFSEDSAKGKARELNSK